MRILMLNNEFPPLGGGTGTVNLALLDQFSRIPNLEIDLITSALGKQFEAETFSETIRIYKVPVNNRIIHHSSNRELLIYAFRALLFAFRLQRESPYDFCFAWSAVPAGGVAWAVRKLTGLRYLVRVCGPDIPGFERRYGFLYPLLTPIIKAIWKSAEVVVAKCQGEADMIRSVDDNPKIELIPNGVDAERFQPAPSTSRDGPLHLLCVARLIERKGQNHLIAAVAKMVTNGYAVQLDLIGTGDSEVDYRSLVKKLEIEDHVRFLGYIPREDIPRHYARADVFVLASFNEGMSVATLEAMASGLPVVVTRTGGMDELVEAGINGFFFDWADVNGLVAHLELLINDGELRENMAEASRLRSAHFTWDEVANTYFTKFRAILSE